MTDDAPWLDERERAAWLGLLRLTSALPAALESQLQRDTGLGLFEYLVLAMLSEQPEHTAQLKSLAVLAGGSQSRLSHALTRLEQRGYLTRYACPENGRITLATLTDTGWATVRLIAPSHVATVRQLVFDALTPGQVTALNTITSRLNARLP